MVVKTVVPKKDCDCDGELRVKIERDMRAGQARRVFYIGSIIFVLLTGGAFVFHVLEGWSWLNSLYFATVTLTTVGYGDLVPTHEATRAFIIAYLLVGVSTVLYGLGTIAQYYVEKREHEFETRFNRLRKGKFRLPTPPTMRK